MTILSKPPLPPRSDTALSSMMVNSFSSCPMKWHHYSYAAMEKSKAWTVSQWYKVTKLDVHIAISSLSCSAPTEAWHFQSLEAPAFLVVLCVASPLPSSWIDRFGQCLLAWIHTSAHTHTHTHIYISSVRRQSSTLCHTQRIYFCNKTWILLVKEEGEELK